MCEQNSAFITLQQMVYTKIVVHGTVYHFIIKTLPLANVLTRVADTCNCSNTYDRLLLKLISAQIVKKKIITFLRTRGFITFLTKSYQESLLRDTKCNSDFTVDLPRPPTSRVVCWIRIKQKVRRLSYRI